MRAKCAEKGGIHTKVVMNTLIDGAMKVAFNDVAMGRNVMVLVPNSRWRYYVLRQYGSYAQTQVWIRASTIESSLKSLALDTLILVGQSHPEWNKKGEMYSREKLKTSIMPRVLIFDNPEETKKKYAYEAVVIVSLIVLLTVYYVAWIVLT